MQGVPLTAGRPGCCMETHPRREPTSFLKTNLFEKTKSLLGKPDYCRSINAKTTL